MAITVDQTTIGSAAIDATATSIPFTTSATVAANGFIVVTVGWFSSTVTLSSISGGGLTWAVDIQGKGTSDGNTSAAVCSAQAPSGLASGTVLTANFSATTPGRSIAGTSFTGVLSSAALDTTSGPTNLTTGTTAWASASTTIAAGSLLIALGGGWTTNGTNTPTAPSIETADLNGGAGTFNTATEYRIEAVGGAYTIAGTFSTTQVGVVCAAAYKVAPATVGQGTGDAVLWSDVSGPGADYGPLAFIEAYDIFGTAPQTIGQALTADAVAVTASMLKQVNKIVTATAVAVTASIVKQVNHAMVATAVAVTASLTTIKVKLLAMTATTVVVTASMLKQVNKLLTATAIVVTASMIKQVNKTLTATAVAVTATLSTIKVKLVTMTATTVVVTASMVRQVGTHLTAASVALSASVTKQVNKRLTATTVAVTASLTTIKVKLVTMTATTVAVTASMLRQTQLHLSATVGLSASIVKRIAKTLAPATSIVTATLDAIKGGVATFFTAMFDATVGRGNIHDDPDEADYSSDAHGNIRSDPTQGGFD